MRPDLNPLIPQFWLWGLDAIAGDLTARGFQKLQRPAQSDPSVYRLGTLHLHGFGLWFESDQPESDTVLVYRRPTDTWYALPKHAKLCIEHFSSGGLAWCDFARPRLIPDVQALELVRPVILEHEQWIASRHGTNLRVRQLERVTSRLVRRARNEWFKWLDPVTSGLVPVECFGP
jgi:hypothetical protein